MKSDLAGDIGRSQYLYEREHEILQSISTLISEVELANNNFRSQKVIGSNTSDKIFFELQDKIKETTNYIFKVRAFIPDEIIHEAMRYIELINIHHMDIGLSEPDELQERKMHWMQADFNVVSESGKSLVELIRMRVNQWYKL
ncbi:hypothetical protein NO559_00460 [Dasania sp. GY-MA-18]|uniref:Uncharacterized protein n=1 Tax=Dasania phycosphaerae TaxID=2950436 RepID=A0A9J6RH26_9GAMM|nr:MULTISPECIES: hypothetical protein [Dasania]MCR8921222.1 hypothetical protein [Dasania sp. GY-MA-18]MCZ0863650.1 hypothetical protein [Dasania phycosphaerae]MCZ0867378.1 hypothetical protein [Dasania phycosphaerae]